MIAGKIKSLISQYNNSSLSKNIFTVFSGTALAQLIQLAGSLLLVLYFSPDQFGVFALYVSFASLLSIVATARYEMAIVLPEREDESRLLVIICFAIAVAIAALSFIIIIPLKSFIINEFSSAELGHYLIYIPASVFFTGIFQAAYNYGLRGKQFKMVSAVKVFQSVTFVICPIIMWYAGHKEGGMISGYVLSQVLSAIVILFCIDITGIIKTHISTKGIKALVIRYKNFPGINSLHALMDSAQTAIINSLIAALYGNTVLGLYSMAYRLLRAPMGVISAAVSQVLFPQMSDNYNKGISNYKLTTRFIKYLTTFAIPLFILIAAVSPFAFRIFLGPQWEEAGWYVIYLCPWVAATFVSSPLSHLPNITSRQFYFLVLTLIINVASFFAFYILHSLHSSIYISLLSFSLSWFVGIALQLLWFVGLSKEVKLVQHHG